MSFATRGPDLSALGDRPTARIGFVLPFTCVLFVFLGLLFGGIGLAVGGSHFGTDVSLSGTIVQVDNGRPTVQYTVDGQTYQVVSAEHGPQYSVGQPMQVCYASTNPADASTCTDRTVGLWFVGTGAVMLLVAMVLGAIMVVRRGRLTRVAQSGYVVSATITGARINSNVHMVNKVMGYIQCAWTDPATGSDYQFSSPGIWVSTDPMPKLQAAAVTSLPVYIDPADPAKNYMVDDRPVRRVL